MREPWHAAPTSAYLDGRHLVAQTSGRSRLGADSKVQRSPGDNLRQYRPRIRRAGPRRLDSRSRGRLHFTQPGKPVEGAFSESFNGKFRYEFLNEHGITTLAHAGEVTEARRMDYNAVRPHSGSENLTPHEHAQQIHASIPTGLFIIGGPDFGDRSERRISRKRAATRSK